MPPTAKAQLYRARYLVPMAGEPLEDGAVLVEAGRIVAVGPYATLRRHHAALIDCGDAILLPPLVNAHTHLELTDFPTWAAALADLAAGETFVDWIRRVVQVKRARSGDDFAASVKHGIAQSLAAGTGAVGDILSHFAACSAYAASPLRGRLFFETLGHDPARTQPQLQEIATLLAAGLCGRLLPGLAPHAPYSLSAAHLAATVAQALREQAPLTLHAAESREEVALIRAAAGPIAQVLYPLAGWELPSPQHSSPIAYLSRQGALTPGMLLVHGVQVDAADVALIAAAGCGMVLCPRSNARLGVGTAPAALYRQLGVPLALGTDSLASNDSLSLWDEIAAARRVYPAFSPPELLHLATAGGAALLGLTGEMGTLHPGSGAHFQLLRPNSLPALAELAEFLASPGRSAEVAELFLDGEEVLAKEPALRL